MKIMTIQVPDDSVDFIEEFVERIGGHVEKNKEEEGKKKGKSKASKKAKPLDFFGTWPDINLNPETYREKLWRKVPRL